jgi:nucleoside-diphosphate-sugar epimerase
LNYVVVGGAGAIGRAFLADFRPPGDVFVLDRVACDFGADVTSRPVDCKDVQGLSRCVERIPGDVHLVLLAAPLENRLSLPEASDALQNHMAAVANPILLFGARAAVITLVSSVSVYGRAKENPIPETAPLRPCTLYGTGKAASEQVARGLAEVFGSRLTVLRPTQLFGLASAADTLPHMVVQRGASGRPLVLHGSGDALRDYLHVEDFVNVLRRQIEQPRPGTFNVGSGAPVSIKQLVQAAAERFGVPIEAQAGSPESFSQYLETRSATEAFGLRPGRPVIDWVKSCAPAV